MGWIDRIRGFFTTDQQAQPPAGTARNPWDNDDGVVNDVVAAPGPAPMPAEEPVAAATDTLELDRRAAGPQPTLFKPRSAAAKKTTPRKAAPRKSSARKTAAARRPRSSRSSTSNSSSDSGESSSILTGLVVSGALDSDFTPAEDTERSSFYDGGDFGGGGAGGSYDSSSSYDSGSSSDSGGGSDGGGGGGGD